MTAPWLLKVVNEADFQRKSRRKRRMDDDEEEIKQALIITMLVRIFFVPCHALPRYFASDGMINIL